MLRIVVMVGIMIFSKNLIAQNERRVDSKITDVTVFLNRAQVTRSVKTRIDAGKTNLIVQGLTSSLDQQSIQVSGKGKFTILGISHQQNFVKEFSSPKIKTLKDSIELVRQSLILEQGQKEILTKEEQMLQSNQKIGGTNQNLTVAELKGMADFFRARLGEIIAQRMRYDKRIKSLNESLVKLQAQLLEQDELHRKNTSEIVVSISSDGEVPADLEISYVVGNAGWIPVYDLRAIDTKHPVQLSYKANVFQGTGEDWKSVNLKLSTANPSLGGVKPELSAWYIDIIKPIVVRTARYRHDADAKAAPAAAEVMYDKAEVEDSESVADYTTTIQTSLNTEFSISLPYTVTSSNKPTLVDIAAHSLKADYLYSVAPKLDKDAFLMARITGWEEFSLLPGEANIFFEGTFVAKSYIDPNNIKDTLSVSLGRDKRIIVQREKIKDLSSRHAIGANQREDYSFAITIRNAKAEPIRIIVEDHIPVSQNAQLEIHLADTGGADFIKDSGKLKWELVLQPQESKKLTYRFEVKYPKDKNIPEIY